MKLLCPNCGGFNWYFNKSWEGTPYLQHEVIDSMECFDCGIDFEIK